MSYLSKEYQEQWNFSKYPPSAYRIFGFVFSKQPGYAFHVNISVESLYSSEIFYDPYHTLHRIVWVVDNARTKKKTFDIVATIKLNCKINQFLDGESSSTNIITPTVDTICTIINTVVG